MAMVTTTITAMAQKSSLTGDKPEPGRRANAVQEALELFRQPARLRFIDRTELPVEMLDVIKIAAGDDNTIQLWADTFNEVPNVVREAAVFYLQQTIARSGVDNFRMLGLQPGAATADIRAHKRWLLKWLHPDRNPSKWQAALFYRVSGVADQLESLSAAACSLPAEPSMLTKSSHGTSAHMRRQRLKPSQRRSPTPQVSWSDLIGRLTKRAAFVAMIGAFILLLWLVIMDPVKVGAKSMAIWL
jgi:hypothetical protein